MDQAVALALPTTPEAFLDWEQLQEGKYEFDGHGPVSMNGGTREHAILEVNIVSELRVRLRGSGYEVFGGTMKVRIGAAWRYPDASVSCTPVAHGSILVPAPVVLFEVVSPSSRVTDRRTKLREYGSLPSVQRYVLLSQDECALTVFGRDGSGDLRPAGTLGENDVLHMPEIGVGVPLAALYEGVLPRP